MFSQRKITKIFTINLHKKRVLCLFKRAEYCFRVMMSRCEESAKEGGRVGRIMADKGMVGVRIIHKPWANNYPIKENKTI